MKINKITREQAISYDWDQVKSLNYKLPQATPYQSVIWAELEGDHSWVTTTDLPRIYYVLEGEGEFETKEEKVLVRVGDVITIPPHTKYNYHPSKTPLKVLLFMELWDN